ncbi:hypothetical protein IFVP203_C1100172 [Vibrio parahaemolyticus]
MINYHSPTDFFPDEGAVHQDLGWITFFLRSYFFVETCKTDVMSDFFALVGSIQKIVVMILLL